MERQDGREDFLTAIMGGEKQGLTLEPDALFSNAMGLTSVHPFFLLISLISTNQCKASLATKPPPQPS